MARPPLALGSHGEIQLTRSRGQWLARCRYRDLDGTTPRSGPSHGLAAGPLLGGDRGPDRRTASRLRTPRTEREPTTCASERLLRQRAAFRLRRRGSCEAGRSTWTPALELLAIGLPSRGHACRARPSITDRTGGPPSSGSGRHTKRARSPSTSIRAPVTVLVTARPHRGLPDPRPQAGHRRHDTSRPRAHRQMPAACTADCQRAGPGKRHRRPTAGQDRPATGDGRRRPPG